MVGCTPRVLYSKPPSSAVQKFSIVNLELFFFVEWVTNRRICSLYCCTFVCLNPSRMYMVHKLSVSHTMSILYSRNGSVFAVVVYVMS